MLIFPWVFVSKTLVQPRQRRRDKRFGTWYVRSLYKSSSHTKVATELAKYKLDLVGVQEGAL